MYLLEELLKSPRGSLEERQDFALSRNSSCVAQDLIGNSTREISEKAPSWYLSIFATHTNVINQYTSQNDILKIPHFWVVFKEKFTWRGVVVKRGKKKIVALSKNGKETNEKHFFKFLFDLKRVYRLQYIFLYLIR